MALPFPLHAVPRCAVFTNAMPTNYRACHDFNCYINERETPKTCLTNHKGSISHHIMPLVINSLGGGHTHTHTQARSHHGQKQFQETSRVPAKGQHMPGLKTKIVGSGMKIFCGKTLTNY